MLRTLFAVPAVFLATVFFGSAALVVRLVRPRASDAVCLGWSRAIVWACGARIETTGLDHLDPSARYVFISNHLSLFDIPALWVALENPFRFVAKRELARIPLFGPAMKAVGTVTVDRSDPVASARALEEALAGIARRVSLLFFAEGTRSPDGSLGRFKKGGIVTAAAMGVPLVPIAICGTREVVPKGTLRVRRATVGIAVGTPIHPPANPSPAQTSELRAQLESAVAQLLPVADALRKKAPR